MKDFFLYSPPYLQSNMNTNLLLVALLLLYSFTETTMETELPKGFEASPEPSVSYQHLLNDSSGNFSLSFIRVNSTQLDVAVIHLPSLEALWRAGVATTASWSGTTKLIFNGSLMIADDRLGVVWSTDTMGDRLVLLNTSNLQIRKLGSILWQSFDFPQDTLVENQNFTINMTIVSSNGLYNLRLGKEFMGLYAKLGPEKDQIYWRHKALEEKGKITDGNGPIFARVNSDGFLGMYQTGDVPVDVQAFTTFQRGIGIGGLVILRLELDGNLRGYYWDGGSSKWVLSYEAITEACELPSPCGSFGLCTHGSGCSCLDNRTTGDGCHGGGGSYYDTCKTGDGVEMMMMRRSGVDLPFKHLMGFERAFSSEQCESACRRNCSCYGAVYNNASGFCYVVDYPIRTMVGTRDENKVGFFKVWDEVSSKKKVNRTGLTALICAAVLLCLILAVGSWGYKMYRKRKMLGAETGLGVDPGPYKDLGSFRFIEMSSR